MAVRDGRRTAGANPSSNADLACLRGALEGEDRIARLHPPPQTSALPPHTMQLFPKVGARLRRRRVLLLRVPANK
eukprot:3157377-Rhodomonas_salina.1